jgi:hypothetical protein
MVVGPIILFYLELNNEFIEVSIYRRLMGFRLLKCLKSKIKVYRNGAKLAVEKVSGDVGKKIQTKFKDVLARNPGIQTIMDVAVIHREGVGTTPLTIKQTSALKSAPVTFCETNYSSSYIRV